MSENDETGKDSKSGGNSGTNFSVALLSLLVVVGILLAFGFSRYYFRGKDSPTTRECRENMETIGVALQEYAGDNNGQYPESLDQLVPAYLGSIPSCPSANRDTYGTGYTVSSSPARFTLRCSASHGSSGVLEYSDGYPSSPVQP